MLSEKALKKLDEYAYKLKMKEEDEGRGEERNPSSTR